MADLAVKGVAPRNSDKKNYNAGINIIVDKIEQDAKSNTTDANTQTEWQLRITDSFAPFLLNPTLGANVSGQHYDDLESFFNTTYAKNIRAAGRAAKVPVTVDLEMLFGNAPGKEFVKQQFINNNVSLIKSIPERLHSQVQNVISDNFAKGFDREQLTNDIEQRFSVARSRAKLIANDQSNKAIGQLAQLRSLSLGANTYRWQTAEDDRVRPTHEALNDTIQNWNAPPAIGNPGEPINCRCIAVTIIDSDLLAAA